MTDLDPISPRYIPAYLIDTIDLVKSRCTLTVLPDQSYKADGIVVINRLITSLPTRISIAEKYDCSWTSIRSLVGAPHTITDSFDCDNTKITSLVDAPSSVDGYFSCQFTNITSLVGAPLHVGGSLHCAYSELITLEGMPKFVGGSVTVLYTKITTLHRVDRFLHDVEISGVIQIPEACTHLLSLLYCPGIWHIRGPRCSDIINMHLHRKERDIHACQEDLIEAGFTEQAKL